MLTKREKKLMYDAFFVGFDCGMNDAENGYSNTSLKSLFNEWLNEQVADNGGTIEQLLDFNNKET